MSEITSVSSAHGRTKTAGKTSEIAEEQTLYTKRTVKWLLAFMRQIMQEDGFSTFFKQKSLDSDITQWTKNLKKYIERNLSQSLKNGLKGDAVSTSAQKFLNEVLLCEPAVKDPIVSLVYDCVTVTPAGKWKNNTVKFTQQLKCFEMKDRANLYDVYLGNIGVKPGRGREILNKSLHSAAEAWLREFMADIYRGKNFDSRHVENKLRACLRNSKTDVENFLQSILNLKLDPATFARQSVAGPKTLAKYIAERCLELSSPIYEGTARSLAFDITNLLEDITLHRNINFYKAHIKDEMPPPKRKIKTGGKIAKFREQVTGQTPRRGLINQTPTEGKDKTGTPRARDERIGSGRQHPARSGETRGSEEMIGGYRKEPSRGRDYRIIDAKRVRVRLFGF